MKRTEQQIIKIIDNQLCMPRHKILYMIKNESLVKGLWGMLHAYGVPFTKKNHELLIEIVQTKVEGSTEIERDWTEQEFKTFVSYTE